MASQQLIINYDNTNIFFKVFRAHAARTSVQLCYFHYARGKHRHRQSILFETFGIDPKKYDFYVPALKRNLGKRGLTQRATKNPLFRGEILDMLPQNRYIQLL